MDNWYCCLKTNLFADARGYSLRPITLSDGEPIRLWRNAQMDILRQQKSISPEDQRRYFEEVISPLKYDKLPPQILMSFCLKGQLIGYGGLTHLDWYARCGEVSFLVNPVRLEGLPGYDKELESFLNLLWHLAFKTLDLHRLFSETYSFRKEHMQVLENFGFKHEGILREHVWKKGRWFDSHLHGLLAADPHPLTYPLVADIPSNLTDEVLL